MQQMFITSPQKHITDYYPHFLFNSVPIFKNTLPIQIPSTLLFYLCLSLPSALTETLFSNFRCETTSYFQHEGMLQILSSVTNITTQLSPTTDTINLR
jgi:hypothetical protein